MAPEQITALVAIGESEMLEFKQSMGRAGLSDYDIDVARSQRHYFDSEGNSLSGVQLFSHAPQLLVLILVGSSGAKLLKFLFPRLESFQIGPLRQGYASPRRHRACHDPRQTPEDPFL